MKLTLECWEHQDWLVRELPGIYLKRSEFGWHVEGFVPKQFFISDVAVFDKPAEVWGPAWRYDKGLIWDLEMGAGHPYKSQAEALQAIERVVSAR